MDITVQKAMGAFRNLEPQLTAQLAASNVSYAQLEDTLNQICVACSTALLQDFEAASNQHAEVRIWESHQKVHQYYRSALAKLKSSKEPSTVARRKLEGSYLRFIKSAQRFYRGYIRNLSATHGGIPELERVARKVSSDGQAEIRRNATKAPPNKILRSCHTTLIYLGDLSRYRETELPGKERNWGPAVGFYDLATSILPSSGLSYNQLAVIALLDGSLFRATYQLWRSLSTEAPHPQADQNLIRALKKVNTAWKDADLKDSPSMTAGAGLPKSMVACYLRLISQTYLARSFAGRDELENEVVNQLAVDLRKHPLESSPHKLVIINIAAGHREQERPEDLETGAAVSEQSYFLRLNIRMFITFIRVFLEHVDGLEHASNSGDDANPNTMAKRLTPSIRRLLPALHLYSLWLHKNTIALCSPLDESLSPLRAELWAAYAQCLTSVTQVFPPENLQTVKHLLEEEEDTIGFKPLHCPDNRETWYSGDGLKARWHDLSDHGRDSDMEMLSRLTSFMIVGVKLAVNSETPIVLDEVTCNFNYQERTPSSPPIELAGGEMAPAESQSSSPNQAVLENHQTHGQMSIDADIEDLEAQRMVDSIVGPEDFADESSVAPQSWPKINHGGESPTTTNLGSSILGSSSIFPVGPHTANDLLEAVQNYSRNQRKSATPIPAFPGLGIRTNSSSAMQSPGFPSQPLLSPAPSNGFSERMRTPQAGTLSRPSTAARTSPLAAPPGLGHSRMNSNDSTSSTWVPNDTWTSYQPSDNTVPAASRTQRRSLYNDRALGNGTFGDLVYRRESNHDIKADVATGSPSLGSMDHDAWRRGSGSFGRAASHFNGTISADANLSSTNSPAMKNMQFGYSSFSRPLT